MNIGYIVSLVLGAVVLLGICIFIHELGHLIGGKMVGIKARIFSLGYGKGVLKKKIGDTTYQITLIPFGGYCAFYGDEPGAERKGEPYEFLSAPPLKRIVPVVMGPLFNLFLGIIIFFGLNLVGYQKESNRVTLLDEFAARQERPFQSPAYRAGIRTGDRIVEINGERIAKFTDIQRVVFFSGGKPLAVKAERDGAVQTFSVTPEAAKESRGRFSIGVMPYITAIEVGKVLPGGAGKQAGLRRGDRIVSVDGARVIDPEAFIGRIKSSPGKQIVLKVARPEGEVEIGITPALREEIIVQEIRDSRSKGKEILLTGEAVRESIAKGALKINDAAIASYEQFLGRVEAEKRNIVKIETGRESHRGFISYRSYGFIGMETGIAEEMVTVRYGLGQSVVRAFVEPYEFIVMNLKGIGMLFSGKLNVRENLSGPIFIAKIAGDVAYYQDIASFILLIAQISIILMVMNLLPIPMVDGSYIVLFLIEAVRGKPLSEKVMERIQFIGMALLILLGVFVIFNDIAKIFHFM